MTKQIPEPPDPLGRTHDDTFFASRVNRAMNWATVFVMVTLGLFMLIMTYAFLVVALG